MTEHAADAAGPEVYVLTTGGSIDEIYTLQGEMEIGLALFTLSGALREARNPVPLYDVAQALAHIAGKPIPITPSTGPHPSDLLTDKEAGALLGIDPSTVRAYATTGYLPKGTDRHGRTWWPRHAVTARRDAGDLRHQNPGQQPGDPRNRAGIALQHGGR
ncbi:helix-turn-helix domain-containing protein [Streptomyces sp. NPDC058611]|uniref:helix-turn-helix domain-containing protein n=1 Tax=unclassified Streptomyces TaxID=2593676 RepID=UPI003648465F